MHRHWLMLLLLFTPVGAVSGAALPATSAYDIEVLVFENRLPDLDGNEQWTASPDKPQEAANAVTLGTTPAGSDLAKVATALQNDARYRLLTHRRWIQAADNKLASSPVLVQTDNREVDGHVRFYMSRFLHVELSLAFQPQVPALGSLEPAPAPYRLTEERRIRSQELHYFDHPKFGALVRVVPASAAALGGER